MNIEERAAQAAAWKATGQCNCAQSVLKAFEDKLPVALFLLVQLLVTNLRVMNLPHSCHF